MIYYYIMNIIYVLMYAKWLLTSVELNLPQILRASTFLKAHVLTISIFSSFWYGPTVGVGEITFNVMVLVSYF